MILIESQRTDFDIPALDRHHLPPAPHALGQEEMYEVFREYMRVQTGDRGEALVGVRCRQIMARQCELVREFPGCATGFEVCNLKHYVRPLPSEAFPEDCDAEYRTFKSVQRTIRELGFNAAEMQKLHDDAGREYAATGVEAQYRAALMQFYPGFIAPLYKELRKRGHGHSMLLS